ncbi:MAG: hypothetical protein EOM66_08370 [Clostridia bacterium]|nr:hypothetical protein [Candidatus Pelethousia sp.]NCB31407.1 hypothetical protein [Clostridia bacterium]
MIRRPIKLVFVLVLCLGALMGGCALPAGNVGEARILAEARQNYRDASLVVSGVCTQSYIDADGEDCYDLSIEQVLAGQAEPGDTIHCNAAMDIGQRYLLYLQQGENVFHTEDMLGYTLVSGEPLALADGKVFYGGQSVDLNTLLQDMASLNTMISAPSVFYYYDEISALAQAADDIFIGRVSSAPVLADTQFRSQNSGATVERTVPASVVEITAYGGIRGALKYGDKIKLVYAPDMNADVLNAATLTAEPYTEAQTPVLEAGDIYLFFTLKGPDAKQSYYFLINPMQGFVSVTGDLLDSSSGNRALRNIQSLDVAVNAIRKALQGTIS